MAPAGDSTPPPSLAKPPSKAAQMEIQNRISLATSRMAFLDKYRRQKSKPASAAETKASFSALSGSRSKVRPSPTEPPGASSRAENASDDDEPPLVAAADPNSGLGHTPAAAATAAARKDAALRARLVGKRQHDAAGKPALSKRDRKDESSEDDEPGRSGLGRSKKQKRRGGGED